MVPRSRVGACPTQGSALASSGSFARDERIALRHAPAASWRRSRRSRPRRECRPAPGCGRCRQAGSGRASRIASIGIRVCPPAITRAPSSAASSAHASLDARWPDIVECDRLHEPTDPARCNGMYPNLAPKPLARRRGGRAISARLKGWMPHRRCRGQRFPNDLIRRSPGQACRAWLRGRRRREEGASAVFGLNDRDHCVRCPAGSPGRLPSVSCSILRNLPTVSGVLPWPELPAVGYSILRSTRAGMMGCATTRAAFEQAFARRTSEAGGTARDEPCSGLSHR